MPRIRLLTNSGFSKTNSDPGRCGWIQRLACTQLIVQRLPAKRQRIADLVKITLDVAKESSDWFPPLKSALGGVNALVRHYEVLTEWMTLVRS